MFYENGLQLASNESSPLITALCRLLCGLEAFMTEQEQQFVTYLLTSGDTTKLAAATEMMHHVSSLSRQGIFPNMKRQKSSFEGSQIKRSMMESIREVIREGNEERRKDEEKGARYAVGVAAKQLGGHIGAIAGERREQKLQNDLELRKQMEYLALHPLPLRMPKYAELYASSSDSFALTFLDDEWDGTVLDAFTKITVNKSLLGKVTIKKQHADSRGIRNIIDACSVKKNGKGVVDTPTQRVIVASIGREGGQQGIVKGDVVTHFNGEEFVGTAGELIALIESINDGELLTFAFNADKACAEALRRRSILSKE